jgi:hypothetical protein
VVKKILPEIDSRISWETPSRRRTGRFVWRDSEGNLLSWKRVIETASCLQVSLSLHSVKEEQLHWKENHRQLWEQKGSSRVHDTQYFSIKCVTVTLSSIVHLVLLLRREDDLSSPSSFSVSEPFICQTWPTKLDQEREDRLNEKG